MSNDNPSIISWQAPEYRFYEKNIGWYATLIAIAILIMAFFIVAESDIFGAVSIGILAVLAVIFSMQKPRLVDISLTHRGVKFGNLFYPYKQMKYFWVVHNPRHQTINFHTSALINNVLILELDDQDPDVIRNFLLKYLLEHSETEATNIQRIMHRVKF